MLVLSRHVGESLVIGSGDTQVEVVVTQIAGNKVKIGVIADRQVEVRRGELDWDYKHDRRVA